MDTPGLDDLVYWTVERAAVRRRREAGEPPPWSEDPLLATYRFCNVNVQDDRVSRAILDLVTRPHADHPGLIVALTVCRFSNEPEVIAAIADALVPFEADRFVAIMRERQAQGLKLERRAYIIPGGVPGQLKAVSNAQALFTPLANAVEQIRPRASDTCESVFERLSHFPYLGGFLGAQIIRDLKQVDPLRSSPDWSTFVRSGPGSQRGLNRILGATTEADINRQRPEVEWRKLFQEIVALAAPRLAEHGITDLDAQSWQNCFCETDKFLRFRSGDLRGARRYGADGANKPRKARIAPVPVSPAPLAPVSRALPALAAARDPSALHVLHHDIETRSKADLKKCGAWRYGADPSTDVLCLAYAVDDEPVQLWIPGDPVPTEFIEAATNLNWLLVAHNAGFERAIAYHILGPCHGFPLVPIERHRCTMAMALACGLPGKLEKVAEALGLKLRKDAEGTRLMRLMSRPLPDGTFIEDPVSLERLYRYCATDVEVERELVSTSLPPLSDDEQALWQLDAKINDRGFFTDGPLLEAASHIAAAAYQASQDELARITEGALASTDKTAKLLAWLAAHGCEVKDVTKGTLKHALRRKGLDPIVGRVIELRLGAAHAAAVKVDALLAWRNADGRVRGTLQFHGAGPGRWTGRGPQPQNFKRDGEDIDSKIGAVATADLAHVASLYPQPLEVVGDIARAMICAAPGHRLLIGDFSGIESRVTAWVSGQQSKLDQWANFDRIGDPKLEPYYLIGRACGLPEPIARDKGKVADLAFGYMGSVGAWDKLAPEDDASSDADKRRYQQTWRSLHPQTVGFWSKIDRATIEAVRQPGQVINSERYRLSVVCEGNYLRITLPSGRRLSYPFPRLGAGKYGDPVVIFKDSVAGKFTDCRFGQGAWPGLWTENIVQAVARDLLAAAMQRLEAAGFCVTLHVHDEVVCEVPEVFGSLEEFQRLLTQVPEWAAGLPIAAKVREGQRFSKPSEPISAAHDNVGENPSAPAADPAARITAAPEAAAVPLVDDSRPLWKPPKIIEVLPGSAEFEEILAGLDPDDQAFVRPPKLNGATDALEELLGDIPPSPNETIAAAAVTAGGPAPAEPSTAAPPPILTFEQIWAAFNPPPRQPDEAPSKGNGKDNGYDPHAGADSRGPYPHGERRDGHLIATYLYRDHLGRNHTKIEKRAARDGGRAQYPQSFWVDGKWVQKKPKGWLKIPYRLPELLAAPSGADIFIPEGEKDAESLRDLGLIATTASEGATPLKAKIGKWAPELNKWFSGIRRVFILEDNDEPGRKYAREKTCALAGIVPDIRVVSFPEVPDGEDVTWWLQHGHGKDELLARCEAAPAWRDGGEGTLESVCGADVIMRAIEWLWPNRFALGKIGIIAGLPDEGKGQVLCYIAARVTRGLAWPNAEGGAEVGNVIVLSAEEDPATNLAPRLAAAGADLSRIHFLKMVSDRDEKTGQPRKRMFSLITDLEKLRRKIAEVGNIKLLLIDPVSAYLGIGQIDSYRDTDVRAVLGPLKELAEELVVAIITVMHFNKKIDITNALLRVSNSMAFVGLPRHAYGVIADPENKRKLFVRAKNNDAAESDNQTLAYQFNVREVGSDPKSGATIRAPFIVWQPDYVDITATEAMQAASQSKSPGVRDKAKHLLLALLADGREVFVDEIKDAAGGHGIAWRTVRRAADELKIVFSKERTPNGKWFWKLPQEEDRE